MKHIHQKLVGIVELIMINWVEVKCLLADIKTAPGKILIVIVIFKQLETSYYAIYPVIIFYFKRPNYVIYYIVIIITSRNDSDRHC